MRPRPPSGPSVRRPPCGRDTQAHATWPGVADHQLTDGDLRATADYGEVLADILINRTGASVPQQPVFPG